MSPAECRCVVVNTSDKLPMKKNASKKTPAEKPGKTIARKKTDVTPGNETLAGSSPVPDWFVKARFGMFIHWGLYSMPARHEWVRHHELLTDEQYQVYFDLFNPDLFNPREWAATAKAAGMKYVVITTKHHEGFCLWDSKFTDYKATNTPAGRDLLREIVDAFRAEGLRIGFYYSLLDWHHPDFTTDRIGPYRLLPPEEKAKRDKGRDMRRYARYMRDQITELLTKYGPVDILWYDFSYPGENGKGRNDWESEKLLTLTRKLQPGIVVNNRLDLPGIKTVLTPEQFTPDKPLKYPDGTDAIWEGCHTFSGSWGYHRDESNWKSAKMCIELLVDHVSRGGNLIMNVGPTSRGFFDKRAIERLSAYADWMKYHSRAIYGCGASPFEEPRDARYTYNRETGRLYLHLYTWPFGHITLPGLAGRIRYVQLLSDGSEIKFKDVVENGAVTKNAELQLPTIKPDVLVPVLEIILK